MGVQGNEKTHLVNGSSILYKLAAEPIGLFDGQNGVNTRASLLGGIQNRMG